MKTFGQTENDKLALFPFVFRMPASIGISLKSHMGDANKRDIGQTQFYTEEPQKETKKWQSIDFGKS